jgi:hypothetical protein
MAVKETKTKGKKASNLFDSNVENDFKKELYMNV